ncbi:hypothetical protein FJZ26_06065, partial [Candidatus Parvarchaeota archaeon]|nr:hypothetical protein [Candidatus Parvarchaeota archaeon]
MQESQKKPVQAGALAQASLAQQASIRDISIAIDTYDDIFSDFDPRPYSTRQVSHDFLVEIRARYKETRGGRIEVRFIVPDIERDLKTESVIKKRLREYFAQEKRRLTEAIKKIRYRGAVYVAGGAL